MCKFLFYVLSSICFLCLTACQFDAEKKNTTSSLLKEESLHYAKRFKIKQHKSFKVIELLGNKNDTSVTSTFVLYKNEKPTCDFANAYHIKIPVKLVATMSSIYTTMIDELHELQSVIAIDNVDYYNNISIINAVQKKSVQELSKGPTIEVEKTIALNPDILFTFGSGNPSSDVDKKLIQSQIPIAISLDHLEESPLARAEWIKFIACFFEKEQLADSLFSVTEKKYNYLKTLTESVTKKVTVLTEIKYGDVWYVPSGRSYVANLISDAGASYFWRNKQTTGSLPLSFETVYTTAKECDYWINLYNINSKDDLLSYDKRYYLFRAFGKGHLYNNNKIQNTKGYSNYWETGITHPDAILEDLISVFYPNLILNHKLNYYKKIE